MCIEATLLGCVNNKGVNLEMFLDLIGEENAPAFLDPHGLTELALGEPQYADKLFTQYTNSPTLVWYLLHHNQSIALTPKQLETISDIYHPSLQKELAVISAELKFSFSNLFLLLETLPIASASEVDGLFKQLLVQPELNLAVAEAETFLKTLCGNYLELLDEYQVEIYTETDNGVTDGAVDSILTQCPITIFLTKWLLERMQPSNLVHDLIPVIEYPVPFFCSYYMAWRRSATVWLFNNRSEAHFLSLLPNMYIESLYYLKNTKPVSVALQTAIEQRVSNEHLGC
ncbi:MAG: hypothetical protein ABJV04_18875 [Aliiglaciecola sp.]|uniref:hypothetical protein n=1 Tax=Aliiglaciecola sp. TaxID=1872441 RepID=UPI003298FBD0